MIRYLKLERFKNFREATLSMGPFTLLVGTNASGKSNLRDAFRVLHGLARGYTIAETLGEKWIDGGVLQWRGIRGGIREAAFHGSQSFALELGLSVEGTPGDVSYRIEVDVGSLYPRVQSERLLVSGQEQPGFKTSVMQALEAMRFLDLSPEAMRIPSLPGQTILGDRGENLSSVLQAICQNESTRSALVEWVRVLTPLDVVDFEFVPDQIGRILVTLVEQGGRRVSAYSASDGTLRFLAIIAALLGPHPASFYFFEELENGIHPTRLHLLTSLIERKVSQSPTQIVASSHSPQLLGMLSAESLEHASLVYRLEGMPDARIRRIMDIPEAARVVREQAPATLHASGWFEDAVAFAEGNATQSEGEP